MFAVQPILQFTVLVPIPLAIRRKHPHSFHDVDNLIVRNILVSISKYVIYFVLSSNDGGTNGIQLWVPTIGGRPL
jgi:hypothetical protein